jgi:hypothetical protein
MILVIATQDQENYAAHNGFTGEYYWKMKGGSHYKVTGIPAHVGPDEVVEIVRSEIEPHTDYFRTDILGYVLAEDDYLSDFERSQLDYDGAIMYPEPVIDYAELKAVYEHEYAEWSADLDAQAYGEMV